jgi:glycerophosphoryl diester phosphodiesterase
MMRSSLSAAMALVVCLAACRNDDPLAVDDPVWPNGGHLGGTTPLSDPQKASLEGLYIVDQGSEEFGDTIVMKWNGDYLGVYTGKNVDFMIAQGGNTANSIYIEGFWRSQNNGSNGLVQFSGPPAGPTSPLTGTFGNGSEEPGMPLTLRFLRPINPSQLTTPFWIISHHLSGGAPTVLPWSENSIEMLKQIERYGVNGVEIDVRPTKDGIPILYHDSGLNWRLTQKGPLVGPVEDYNFNQIEASVRLLHGEKIPSLEAFLDTLIDQTKIDFVYIDMKPTTVTDVPAIIAVIKAANVKATNAGRTVHLYAALTTGDIFSAFTADPGFPDILSICELDLDFLHQANSAVWSPRFTSGFTSAQVSQMHAEGRQVIAWTVNVPTLMEQYISESHLDGLDTDFTTLLAWQWYKR